MSAHDEHGARGASDPGLPAQPADSSSRAEAALLPLARLATVLAAAGLLGMVVVQSWQVFARYVLNDSPGWTEPLALLCLNACMSFGAAASVHARSHFRFSLLMLMLPRGGQRLAERLAALAVLLIGALLALYGGVLALDNIDVPMAGAALPQSAPFIPLSLGGLLMALFALPQLLWPRPPERP